MKTFPCDSCGADLEYSPEETNLQCPYCQTVVDIPNDETLIEELDFDEFLSRAEANAPSLERHEVTCESCGATTAFGSEVQSSRCPYCDSPIVLEKEVRRRIRPRSLLPFSIPRKRAESSFHRWTASRWFAPNDLKKRAAQGQIDGIYLPFWTYDTTTSTYYTGSRGEHYWVEESYTTTEGGKSVRRTRQVRKTAWYPSKGRVSRRFDDVLVAATRTLPRDMLEALEPWGLSDLEPYNEAFLSGFHAEAYKVTMADGFKHAKELMHPTIRTDVCRDIGGDDQRISSYDTEYRQVTFKHLLLPVWVSSYRYGKKVYRFLVNARTGEVQGDRPYSWIKITLAVLAAVGLVAGIVLAVQ